jgi:hypothetical protein
MEAEQQTNDKKMHALLEKGKLEIPALDFENKVMDKVFFAFQQKEDHKKNLRLSWLFLVLSAIFFPIAILSFLQKLNMSFTDILGKNFENTQQFIVPAVVLIFCILLLLQIDNLLRLTLRTRLS